MDDSSDFSEPRGRETIKNLENEEFYGYCGTFPRSMQNPCPRSISCLSPRFEITIKNTIIRENYGFRARKSFRAAQSIHKNQEKCRFLWFFALLPLRHLRLRRFRLRIRPNRIAEQKRSRPDSFSRRLPIAYK